MGHVHFINPGRADILALTTMGVNVKDQAAIGYFGTGFKFATAVLLRTGHEISITVQGDGDDYEVYEFHTQKHEIRGKEFDIVYLNETRLGFTTELGKDWEVWQAYRELRCNAEDEGGCATVALQDHDGEFDTCVTVTGGEIASVHARSGQYFAAQSDPEFIGAFGGVEVYKDRQNAHFYRGVRVQVDRAGAESVYSYNITTEKITLNENRSAEYWWEIPQIVARELVTNPMVPVEIIRNVVFNGGHERDELKSTPYIGWSEVFKTFIEEHLEDMRVPEALRKKAMKELEGKNPYQDIELTSSQMADVEEAWEMVHFAGFKLKPHCKVRAVESLGPNVYGKADPIEGIFITRICLDKGPMFIASTLIEELIHYNHGVDDCTREFQDIALNRLVAVTKELIRKGK